MTESEFATLQSLTDALVKFRDERDWGQFHTPRNLATALGIEVAELQQELLWKNDEEVEDFLMDAKNHEKVRNEIADVLIFALLLCEATKTDALQAIATKLRTNAEKYPVHLAKGNAAKYTEFVSVPVVWTSGRLNQAALFMSVRRTSAGVL